MSIKRLVTVTIHASTLATRRIVIYFCALHCIYENLFGECTMKYCNTVTNGSECKSRKAIVILNKGVYSTELSTASVIEFSSWVDRSKQNSIGAVARHQYTYSLLFEPRLFRNGTFLPYKDLTFYIPVVPLFRRKTRN